MFLERPTKASQAKIKKVKNKLPHKNTKKTHRFTGSLKDYSDVRMYEVIERWTTYKKQKKMCLTIKCNKTYLTFQKRLTYVINFNFHENCNFYKTKL